MSTPGHKPARNRFVKTTSSSYALQDYKKIENYDYSEDEEEEEWSDEEDLSSDDDGEEFEIDSEEDSDSDFDEDDDHEYLDDHEDNRYRSMYSAEPGYFYPEQPYIDLPVVPKPTNDDSAFKLNYYVLSPLCDIATIYIKFAILAILIYACALWYTVYYGDLSSLDDMDAIVDDGDADTCPANLSTWSQWPPFLRV